MELEGTILRGRSFEPIEGRVVVEDGVIAAVEELGTVGDDRDRLVLPAFVNAHTHVGDSVAKEVGLELSLEALVAPPDGLKHRILRETPRAEAVDAMRRTARLMAATGTGTFVDFREGGVEGVRALRAAVEDVPVEAIAMGRGPAGVLGVADGYGASGAADADFADERAAAREADKPFAIHAGEAGPRDVEPALDLDPAYLVHMVHAEAHHLERLEAAGVPVVVCPRANLVTGVGLPPVESLLERTTVALGTDNVMLNAPIMFREMEFAAKLFDVTARDVLEMATVAGADLLGLDRGVIEPGREAWLLVLDGGSDNLAGVEDPVRGVVRRASALDVVDVITPLG